MFATAGSQLGGPPSHVASEQPCQPAHLAATRHHSVSPNRRPLIGRPSKSEALLVALRVVLDARYPEGPLARELPPTLGGVVTSTSCMICHSIGNRGAGVPCCSTFRPPTPPVASRSKTPSGH